MPLGVGYMKAVMDRDMPEVDSRVFAYADRLWSAMQADPPDVLMLANYVWNESLCRHFTSLAKRLRKETLVVVGGPNVPIEPDRQIEYFEGWQDLDVYALGEGDFLASEIVRRFLDSGSTIDSYGSDGLPSCLFRASDGTTVHETEWPRQRELEKIPSPWLSGVLDEFFDGRLHPLVETNRGCPFKCTFCVQGTCYYTKVHYFDEEQVKEELTYIARRIRTVCPNMIALTFADPNYGMYDRDVRISAHVGKLQKEYQWPSYIDASTGKNVPERIIKSVEEASGALILMSAVQTMSEPVLVQIKRNNIKLEAYEQLSVYMRSRGLRSGSQTILCLPAETLESHVDGLNQLLDSGIDQLQNFQLMLLMGSEMETIKTRETFGFDSRFRVSPRCFGKYAGENVFDMEEVVVATESLSFEDYVQARRHHLACIVFWNQSWFHDVFAYTDQFGIKRSSCITAILRALEAAEGPAGRFLENFVEETVGELFETREACIEFYSSEENFNKLIEGDIGDNLMNKYRAIASFHLWPELCELAMNTLEELLRDHGAADEFEDFPCFWSDLGHVIQKKHAHGRTPTEILSPVSCELTYDIPEWLARGCPKDPKPFRLPNPTPFHFELGQPEATSLRAALETWTTELSGLTKVARRVQATWQVRKPRAQVA